MKPFPIRTDEDLARAYIHIDRLWGSPVGSPDGDVLDRWLELVEAYEKEFHAIPSCDPIESRESSKNEFGLSHPSEVVEVVGLSHPSRLVQVVGLPHPSKLVTVAGTAPPSKQKLNQSLSDKETP